jgi:flagellar basal body-associated protein FliL
MLKVAWIKIVAWISAAIVSAIGFFSAWVLKKRLQKAEKERLQLDLDRMKAEKELLDFLRSNKAKDQQKERITKLNERIAKNDDHSACDDLNNAISNK